MNTLVKKTAVIGGSVALIGASIWGMSAAVNSIDQTPNISTATPAPNDGGLVFEAPRNAPIADPTPTVEPTTIPEPTVEPVAPSPPAPPAPVAPKPAPAPVAPAPAPAPIKCPAGTKANAVDAAGNESNCEPLNNEGQSCQAYDANNVCTNWYKP